MTKNNICHADDKNFLTILKKNSLVLCDFWADWCNPCKIISPILDEIALEYLNKVAVVKLNVDDNPKSTAQYNIKSIPTILIFKNSHLTMTKVGLLSKIEIKKILDDYI